MFDDQSDEVCDICEGLGCEVCHNAVTLNEDGSIEGVYTVKDMQVTAEAFVSGKLDLTPRRDPGFIDLWTYKNEYEDENGDVQDFMDPRDVVGVGNNFQGVRAFGAIKDKRSLEAIPMFPKVWDKDEDPSGTFTMTQSAPLMVPGSICPMWRKNFTYALLLMGPLMPSNPIWRGEASQVYRPGGLRR